MKKFLHHCFIFKTIDEVLYLLVFLFRLFVVTFTSVNTAAWQKILLDVMQPLEYSFVVLLELCDTFEQRLELSLSVHERLFELVILVVDVHQLTLGVGEIWNGTERLQ